MTYYTLPVIFIILWSSAFVAGKLGVQHSTPFAFLGTRFIIVALIFSIVAVAVSWWRRKKRRLPNPNAALEFNDTSKEPFLLTALVGLLLHGVYLGSTFLAMSLGLGAALAALVASMQPILTTALAVFFLGEKPHLVQWVGIILGFSGVVIVLSPSLGLTAPPVAVMICVVGLAAITGGTLLQKRIGGSIGLLRSNIIQAYAASLFFLTLIMTVETPHIYLTPEFIFALSWQVLAVSTGAYVILMILIKRDSVAATTSLMFLVPPVTAIIAYVVFGEPLTPITVSGFLMASAGVYLVTRYAKRAAKSI
jgi:drug/metabolite transporter (DMT)-like permease